MNRNHVFQFGCLEFTDSYAVITCNEGANIDSDEIQKIQSVLYPAYAGRKFGLIANRKNQYSVNPLAIKKLFSYEHLVAGAIVGYSSAAEENAKVEKIVVKGASIRFFDNMASAIEWVENTLHLHMSESGA